MQECVLSTDRRSVRTRTALRHALAREIDATGDLSRVTVTAVTERAGVTRRTFYSHFRDIPDLVRQIEDETLAELHAPLARLAACHLNDLRAALDRGEPAPGAQELLACVRERGDYLRPLLGNGGDPAFAERIKALAHEVIGLRALDGLDLRALGPLFDYYLTFAISAEVGVLLRWLDAGCRESVPTMARLMTALMFVRPGDLYDNPIDLDIPSFALAVMCSKEDN
ncbi:TetR/AcrR family transcriptional regulator [Olsenella sp. An290]|uniref:TetR/AcrR family transcriptional regulator n=1 Tax=Olsenella sp. An290 TaxID=1965625 RepID=UPI000B388349|nr:TetR/AcrR family transcriptional regulator [Olsenella sp. An290]OUO33980.1 TetR family transcriptional regulator [Olsenella sp. An290]